MNGNLKSGLSKSESDITTADKKKWNSGFPPGVTVDELWLYRKRRPPAYLRPHDNLRPDGGSYESVKSEYKQRYQDYYQLSASCGDFPLGFEDLIPVRSPRPPDNLKLEGDLELNPEYYESFRIHNLEGVSPAFRLCNANKIMENIKLGSNEGYDSSTLSTEIRSKYTGHSIVGRPQPLRRPTNLKLEGELLTTTEQAEQFVQFLLSDRTHLARRSTTLKLEGDMETKTENRDKYVPFDYQKRPPLYKKDTNLHLEGSLDMITEKRQQYVPFVVHDRPRITKYNSNLHLEGELQMQPEYRSAFKEYKVERMKPVIPLNNLRTEGTIALQTETTSKYHEHPVIPFLRGSSQTSRFILGDDAPVKKSEYKDNSEQYISTTEHLKQESEFANEVSTKCEIDKSTNGTAFRSRIDSDPEYRSAYIDFSKPPKLPSRVPRKSSTYGISEKCEFSPEYRNSYNPLPIERHQAGRPRYNLSSEEETEYFAEKRAHRTCQASTTQNEQNKHKLEREFEGQFECQPEYRKAYIDYLIRERLDRKTRPVEYTGSSPQRAFEVVPPKVANKQIEQTTPPTCKDATVQKDTSCRQPEQQEVKPSTHRKTLSKIENTVFGPKLKTLQTPHQSRAVSPVPPRSRRSSFSGSTSVRRRSTSRFNSPVKVENLASKSRSASPLCPPMQSATRNRWQNREINTERSRAFIVLDNAEINRNVPDDENASIYKEQKWMSPWYNPPS